MKEQQEEKEQEIVALAAGVDAEKKACPACGSDSAPVGSRFCNNCGNSLAVEAVPIVLDAEAILETVANDDLLPLDPMLDDEAVVNAMMDEDPELVAHLQEALMGPSEELYITPALNDDQQQQEPRQEPAHVSGDEGHTDESSDEDMEEDDEQDEEEFPEIRDVDEGALDSEMAKTLNNLSLQQRDKALYDIHGVGNSIEETPELIQKSLQELEDLIQHHKKQTSKKVQKQIAAYCLAELQSPDFVKQESFRMLFIRCKQFHIKEACTLLFTHFEVKRELFGDEKVGKQITMKDMDENALNVIEHGNLQILPVRDPAGRLAFVGSAPHARADTTLQGLAKAFWYVAMSVVGMSGPKEQAMGAVLILYNIKSNKRIKEKIKCEERGIQVPLTMRRVRGSVPLRVSSLHMCADPGILGGALFLDWLRVYFLDTALKVRTRIHRGTHMECMQALGKFGFTHDALPWKGVEGTLKRERHQMWLKGQQLLEEKQAIDAEAANSEKQEGPRDTITSTVAPTSFIWAPSQSDVLFGRGRFNQTHVGNLRLRLLLESNMERYTGKSGRGAGLALAKEIVETLQQESNARFLKPQQEGVFWTVVSDQEAFKKVAHDFRTMCKSQNTKIGKKKKDTGESTTTTAGQKRVKGSG